MSRYSSKMVLINLLILIPVSIFLTGCLAIIAPSQAVQNAIDDSKSKKSDWPEVMKGWTLYDVKVAFRREGDAGNVKSAFAYNEVARRFETGEGGLFKNLECALHYYHKADSKYTRDASNVWDHEFKPAVANIRRLEAMGIGKLGWYEQQEANKQCESILGDDNFSQGINGIPISNGAIRMGTKKESNWSDKTPF